MRPRLTGQGQPTAERVGHPSPDTHPAETVCASFLSCDKLPQTWGFRQQTLVFRRWQRCTRKILAGAVPSEAPGGLQAALLLGVTLRSLALPGADASVQSLPMFAWHLPSVPPAGSASCEDICRGAQGPLNPARSYREALHLVTSAKTFFKPSHIHRLWGSALATFVGVLHQPTAGRGQGPGPARLWVVTAPCTSA